MSFERTFKAMRSVIESPGYPYLKHYQQDFYEHDRRFMERNYTSEASYLWIVRECGTHLIPLGVHAKMCDEGCAAMSMSGPSDLFLVKRGQIKKLVRDEALRLLRDFRYRIEGGSVIDARGFLASFSISMSAWSAGPVKGTVRYHTGASTRSLSFGEWIALAQIAECEVIRSSQSLFTPTETILLDGADLRELIAQHRAEAVSEMHPACISETAFAC